MPDHQEVVRPARPEDGDRVWPLARDFATSFAPERAAFDATWEQLVVAPGTLLLVKLACTTSSATYSPTAT